MVLMGSSAKSTGWRLFRRVPGWLRCGGVSATAGEELVISTDFVVWMGRIASFYKKKAKYLLTKGDVSWKVFTSH